MKLLKNDFETYLKSLPLQEETICAVASCFKVKQYKKKDFFARMGDTSDKLGFVVEGLFYMYVLKDDGSLFTKDFIKSGEFLLATFEPLKACSVTIQALCNSVIVEARYSDIRQLAVKHRDFEALSKKGMERRIERIYERLESMATLEANERLLYFRREHGEIEREIPQHILASYLGITPTQLSRIKKWSLEQKHQHM